MKVYKIICELYTEFFRQVSLNKNFTYIPRNYGNLKEQLIIVRFIRWLKEDYNEQFDINFLVDYFKFQFSHYSGIQTKYGKNIIMLHWIIGDKAIKRWKTRDVRKKWIVRVKLRNEVELKLVETFNRIKKQDKINQSIFTKIQNYEEEDKIRFFNTIKGLNYCMLMTTLYNSKSELCSRCNFKEPCKKTLNENHPKLYKLRIDE